MNPAWTSLLAAHGNAPATPAAAGCYVVPLVHLAALDSTGPDSTTFLNNLLSNDVASLPADRAQWSSFSTPKGRMLASFLLWPRGDGHVLVLAADLQAAMAKKLAMYVLRSKVKLSADDDTLLVGVCGTAALATLERANLAAAHDLLTLARHDDDVTVIRIATDACLLALPAARAEAVLHALREAGAVPESLDIWQQSMIRAGLPLITAATQDEFVPQMANLDLIGGVNFKKGCYPGQEIVARTQYLGKLKKRTVRVAFTSSDDASAQVGSDLFSPEFGEQSAGKLLNVAAVGEQRFEALAVLQMSTLDGPLTVGSPTGPSVQVLDLPYAIQEEPTP